MSPQQHQRVKALFTAACELSPQERRALLDRECGDDPQVRAEVEGLLGHDSDPHDSLKTPALGAALSTMLGNALAPQIPAEVPDRIGPYRILRILGVGGMGIVYVAEQDRPRRTVALKVMQAGPGAASLLRRFEHEANLLGRLRHAGIAQIYESGLAGDGPLAKPYIAMEFVEGRPLTEAAISRSLTLRQRVELMVRVCEAVQHAHQRGVIHRDLKPANILLDESGHPKVLDFGVARATDADLQLTSMNTGIGQMVGTLPYMSPEQVTGDPREIDTRSDVYALGVILYQILTGRLPHEPGGRSLPELARMIRDDPPPRLSSIDRTLRGDLDTITAKAMEKEKPRRYQSAAALGDDLKRFLGGEPISAKADSAIYVLGKQIRKHKGPVAAAGLALISLVVFAAYASLQASENKALARQADEARAGALDRAIDAEAATVREAAARAEAQHAGERARAELESANIQRGRMAVQAGSTAAAEELLWPAFLRDPGSPAARWALWEFCCRFGSRAVVQAHSNNARGCVLSPDGKLVYTSGHDGAVRAWDADSLEPIAERVFPRSAIFALRIAPDGGAVVASGGPIGLSVLKPRTLEVLHSIDVAGDLGRCLAFAPDSSRLYVGHVSGRITAWDTATWTLIGECRIDAGQVSAIEVAPGGWPLVGSDTRGWVSVWESLDGPSRSWQAHQDEVPSLALVDGGRTLVTGGNDERAKVWDLATGRELALLSAPNGSVRDLVLSPDGRTMLSSGWWGVLTWNTSTWERTSTLLMPATVFDVAISPDGSVAYAVLETGALRSWRRSHGPEVLRLPGHVDRTVGAISSDGTLIATGDSGGTLRLWSGHDGSLLREVRAHGGRVRTLAFHPTEPWIATCDGGTFIVRDLSSLQPVWRAIDVHAISHASFDFSPDGSTLAVFGRDSRIHLFDGRTAEPLRYFAPSAWESVSLRFSPDSRRLLAVHRGPRAQIIDLTDDSIVATLALNGRLAWSGDFSPDGTLLALGDWGREISIWDTSNWALRHTLTGHAGLIYDVRFSPTGDGTVATAGAEGTVRLWDARQGKPLLTLDRFDGWTAHSVSFSPDGDRLLSCNAHSGEVVVWDLRHYDRDIARHVRYEIERRAPVIGNSIQAGRALAWAAAVLRPEPDASETSPGSGNTP